MKNSKVPDFNRDLKQGQEDEFRFWQISEQYRLEGSGVRLVQLDGKGSDFKLIERANKPLVASELIELKTDSYLFGKGKGRTTNFFMELYSNSERQTPGGPFQAQLHKNVFYVYRFKFEGDIFSFRNNLLVEYLRENDKILPKAYVNNPYGNYSSLGYLVPIDGNVKSIYRRAKGPKEINEKQ